MTITLINLFSLTTRIRLAVVSLFTLLLPAAASAQADITVAVPGGYVYPGNTYSTTFSATNFTPAAGNVYTLQLSDGSGLFYSPVTIGTLSSTALSGTISYTIPSNAQGYGSYKLRMLSSAPAVTGTATTSTLYIHDPALSASVGGGSTYAPGNSISVTGYTNGYLAGPGNVYTLQLSDAGGSFSNPVALGSMTSNYGNFNFYNQIPVSTPNGTGYKVRIVGTNPAVTSTTSSTTITIARPDITPVVPGGYVYPGVTYSTTFNTTNVTPYTGNVYTLQLSDASGNFYSPVTIGTLSSTALSGTISYTIPSNVQSYGSYKLRMVSSSPAITGTATTSTLLVHAPALSASLSGSGSYTYTAGSSISVSGYTNGYIPAADNIYTLQLSNAGGSFSNPVTLSSYTANYSTFSLNAQIPVTTPAGAGYQVRVSGSDPAVTYTIYNSISITAANIALTPGTQFTAGSSYAVPYSVTSGFGIGAGNIFTLQLSDAAGSFAAPATIGTLSSTTASGSITAAIPAGTALGSGYRIRAQSSNPAFTGTDNGANITIAPPQNGLAFDGTDDNIILPAANNLPVGNSPYTLEAWIKPTAMGTYGIIGWGPWGNGNAVNALRLTANGIVNYWWANDLTVTTADLTGAWHHVAATYDGKTRIIYLDGAIAGQDVPAANIHAVPNAANARIGSTNNGEYFSGSIDEVRVWNRALCQAELQNNRNGELPAPATQAGLVAYYPMDQGSAGGTNTGTTSLTDASNAGSTGTLSGFALTGTASNFVTGTTAITGNAALYAPAAPATNSEAISKTVSGVTAFTGCGPLGILTPAGTAPVSGMVSFKNTYDASVQSYSSHAYVQRHYDIEPATNAANATANITLYYTQADFDAYNAANGTDPDLPTTASSTDPNIGNLRINQYHGTGTTPGNYTGAGVLITPASVLYQNGRWEVTFPVTGFSGFFVTGNLNVPLPVTLSSFTAIAENDHNQINWKMGEEVSGTAFAITRSSSGSIFETIGNVAGTGAGTYAFYDDKPLSGINYYRLAITAPGADVVYSNTAVVHRAINGGSITVAPTAAHSSIAITNTNAALQGAAAIITDMQGRQVYRFAIGNSQTVDVSSWTAGIYLLRLPTGEVVRLVKE